MSKTEDLRRAILAIADPDKVSPFNGDMVTLFLHEVEKLVDSAVAAEREECAKMCDDSAVGFFDHAKGPYSKMAKSIRARCTK
jgi:hypothetical protein